MITACRSCSSSRLEPVIDLGEQHTSVFLTTERRPPKYPLEMVVCQDCTLAQLSNTAPPEQLYTDSYSFKSGVNEAIRDDLRGVAEYALRYHPRPKLWLDIASNDGTLLKAVGELSPGTKRTGIDPLKQFADEAIKHADGIVVDFFKPELFPKNCFDVITSVSMFYDLDDPNEFVAGVASVLAQDGVWVIQQNYLPSMLANTAVDNLSHEHLTYFSLTSLLPLLKRHGLTVLRAELNPINGGCIRTLVVHEGTAKQFEDDSVDSLLTEEAKQGIGVGGDFSGFDRFAQDATEAIDNLRNVVEAIVEGGHRVFIYGASTRGAVLWQAAGIDRELVPYAVERNPDKVGKYFSAIGVPIISEEKARVEQPEFLACAMYWLRKGILERESEYLKRGGAFIFPLPKLEIVNQ